MAGFDRFHDARCATPRGSGLSVGHCEWGGGANGGAREVWQKVAFAAGRGAVLLARVTAESATGDDAAGYHGTWPGSGGGDHANVGVAAGSAVAQRCAARFAEVR